VRKIEDVAMVAEPSDFVAAVGLVSQTMKVQHATLSALLSIVAEDKAATEQTLKEAVDALKQLGAAIVVQQEKIEKFISARESEQH
jgi:predicted amino acid-binding ACT domain protein